MRIVALTLLAPILTLDLFYAAIFVAQNYPNGLPGWRAWVVHVSTIGLTFTQLRDVGLVIHQVQAFYEMMILLILASWFLSVAYLVLRGPSHPE